jgi:hypothetical protein
MDQPEEPMYKCAKCLLHLTRDKYSPDDNMRLAICSDCYSVDYFDDLQEIAKLVSEYNRIAVLPKDVIKDIMGDDFDKIAKYIYDDLDDPQVPKDDLEGDLCN